MDHTHEADTPMTKLIQRYATLKVTVSMTREELEDQLHTEVWRSDWKEVLRLLDLAKDGISRAAANECMVLAVQTAPVEVVAALLKLLPDEEYTECDSYVVDWAPTGEVYGLLKWDVSVQGTLVMHAVAKNRPEVLRLLLDHGYDVNCASARAVANLIQNHGECVASYGLWFVPFHAYTARPENYVKLRKWDADPEDIPPMNWEGATPLALAVLLGHAECARILVEHGAWLEEAPSVSSAMYLFWREKDPDYQAARSVVLAEDSHARHRPVLWAVGQTCSPRQLKGVLEAWPYTRKEMEQAAVIMTRTLTYQRDLWKLYTDGWQDLCQRMYRIGRVCPEVLRARTVIGDFLGYFLQWKGVQIDPLLPFLEGATLDLSEMSSGGLYYLDRPAGRQFFEKLAERCQLVMERDAVPMGLPAGILRLLLKHVTFLPTAVDRGVSSLTNQILRMGDLRLIRSALRSGLIPPEESTQELLRCQQAQRLPASCRTALLTTPRPALREKPEMSRPPVLENRWFGDCLPERAMPILDEKNWEDYLWYTLRYPYGVRTVRAMGGEWQVHKTFFAACMEGRADIVKVWLPLMRPEELRNTETILWAEEKIHITMTPLCAAALAGQTKIAELLLEYGAPLREELWGSPSAWSDCWGDGDKGKSLPLNPALAAALGGHWNTVSVLTEQGVVCDWSAPEVQHIWRQIHEEDLEVKDWF